MKLASISKEADKAQSDVEKALHATSVAEIRKRLSNFADAGTEFFGEMARAFGSLGRTAFKTASKARGDRERLKAVREILERAEHDIEKLG